MTAFNPKQLFQANTVRREEWSIIVANPLFHTAIIYAVAQMVANGLSPEQLSGINSLVYMLNNLSETSAVAQPLPSKPLQSYDMPTTTLTRPQPQK